MSYITAISLLANSPVIFAKTATSTSSTTAPVAMADSVTKTAQLAELTKPLAVDNANNGVEKNPVVMSAVSSTTLTTFATKRSDHASVIDPNALVTHTFGGKSFTLPAGIIDKISKANISPNNVSLIVQPLSQERQSKPLFSLFPNIPRIPASTQKLIPTFVALDKLGADFRWVTRIYQHGWLMNGTLHGDVVIVGSGDPNFNHEALRALLATLPAKGIRHIDGDIIVDNSIFHAVNFDPFAFDKQGLRAYNAPPNGFLINFGTLQVDFIPSGRLPLIADNPVASPTSANGMMPLPSNSATAPITVGTSKNDGDDSDDNKAVTTTFIVNPSAKDVAVRLYPPMADFAYPATLPASPKPCVNAKIPRPTVTQDSLTYTEPVVASCGVQTSWFTFPDSDAFITRAVKGTWQTFDPTFKGKIKIQHTPTDNAKKGLWHGSPLGLPLVSHASAPLSEQIWDINHYSNNVMTEQVALSLPVYADKKLTSDYPSTFKFINTWWQQHFKATPPVITRASGLCRDCQVEPASLMTLLKYAYYGKNFETFKDSMGVAGVSGTMKALKLRHPDSPAIGKAWIKTGTLDNVTSMAGYVKGKSGKWYAVVGMVNAPNVGHNDNVKAILDEMLAWTAVQ